MALSYAPGAVLAAVNQPATGTLTVTPHASSKVGDLILVIVAAADTASPNWTMPAPWNRIMIAPATGTGKLVAFTKTFEAGDTTYTLTRSGSDGWRVVPITISGWDSSATPVVGAIGTRAASGGTFSTTAPSITTPANDYTALYIAMERTNAVDNPPTINNGFSVVFEVHNTSGDPNPNAIVLAEKPMPTAGAVGATTATFTNAHASNSSAFLYAIGTANQPVSTGRIGGHAVTHAGTTALTVGAARLGGISIVAVLYDAAGTTELQRVTMPVNATTSWGNAAFTGLTVDTVYTVKFEVDGVLQTDVNIVRAKTKKAAGTPSSFIAIGGSCQFTASNNPVFRAMADKNPEFISHMGDLHYANPTTDTAWRTAVNSSLTAPNFQYMLDRTPFHWTWDNHDRIILDAGTSASPLNMGYTDPATNTQWRTFSGAVPDYLSNDSAGRMWQVGRVMFIQTDNWTNKDDPDAVAEPRTFLGAAQKQAFKNALQAANDSSDVALVVWWCSWTAMNNANGRWASFNSETTELENFIDARPELKKKMVIIGGDSHSLQADSGTRTGSQYRFKGIPSLNISGFNRNSWAGDGSTGWDIANGAITVTNTPEQGWGAYSLLTITDNGKELRFRWEAKRVHQTSTTSYTEDTIAFFERSYGTDIVSAYMGTTQAQFVSMGNTRLWSREEKGSDYTPGTTA